MNRDGRRLRVTLQGDLDVETAESLRDQLVASIGEDRPAEAFFDLCGLTDCSVFARSALVQAQGALKALGDCRTAFVANQPRFRGLALWVINLSEDPKARACMNETVAESWLRGDSTRLDDIKARTAIALTKGGKA